MRLSEGETQLEGRLEVCFSRRWGTVEGEGWSETNSQVVCNDFGYEHSAGKHFTVCMIDVIIIIIMISSVDNR